MSRDWSRRAWLRSAASCALAQSPPRFASYPFGLGVASGDPVADGVVLWTRLFTSDTPMGTVKVDWEVGRDESLRTVVKRGEAVAHPRNAHCVHVDVRGLAARTPYWYRFRVRGAGGAYIESPIGRTKTAPAPNTNLDSFRFAFASCQKYEDGFYTAWRHLTRDDLELVLFLGDYIYEGAAKAGANLPRPHPPAKATTLEDFRARYALYKADPDLQEAHRLFPWMVVWDDHELFNDYAAETIERDPSLRARRSAAYRAFFEHMPIRGARAQPLLYRQLDWGSLTRLVMLDTRRYRSAVACGGGLQMPCAESQSPNRSLLGHVQEKWLTRALTSSPARWQVIAQQIPFARVDREPGPGVSLHMDKWDGYSSSRARLLDVLEQRGRRDTVVLTGDNHNAWVMGVARDESPEGATPLAMEFVCTSISSTGDGSTQRPEYARVLSDNPHAHYLNSRRGYTRCHLTPDRCQTEFLTIPFVSRPGAVAQVSATFQLRHGSMVLDRTG